MRNSGFGLDRKAAVRLRRGWVFGVLVAGSLLGATSPAVAAVDSVVGKSPAAAQSLSQGAAVTIDWTVPSAFTTGMTAIAQGDNTGVSAALAALGDNPLATYLKFRWLMDTVNQNSGGVSDFLKMHPGYPFSKNLKLSLLRSLAKQGDWSAYLAAHDLNPPLKDTTRQRCQTLQAVIETGSITPEQTDAAENIWARGYSQPTDCDPVFAWLQKNHRLTAALYRTRIRAVVLAGNMSLGRYLVKAGSAQNISGLDRYFEGWRHVEQAPEQTIRDALAQQRGQRISATERAHLVRALMVLSRLDPQATQQYLAQIPDIWAIDPHDRDDIARRVALKAAYTRMPQAYDWLKALPSRVQDEETRTWHARAALRAEDWSRLKAAIAAMPEDLAQQPEWQYWTARADAALGDKKTAEARWQALLHEPGYYGFLAADRLGVDYPWPKLPPLPKLPVDQVAAHPAVQLAFYLRAAGLTDDARRAFNYALDEIPADQLPALTLLAEQNHWYDRVSVAIARMQKQNDPAWFAARFPTPWHGAVTQNARTQDVDPNWLYAMIRRESLFMSDVGSGVGAQGLMQLMPRTARWINDKANVGLTQIDLHDPATSIQLGSAYLSYLRDRFPGQLPLAIAAYNAGPGRVKQWLPESRTMPGDVWVDTILFDETRHYVRAVLAGTVIYAWRDRPTKASDAQRVDGKPTDAGQETLVTLLSSIQPANGAAPTEAAARSTQHPSGASPVAVSSPMTASAR